MQPIPTSNRYKGVVTLHTRLSTCYAILLIILVISVSETINAQSWLWAKSMGETEGGFGGAITVDAIAVDPVNGDVYSTGYFQGTVDFDPGPGTYYLYPAGWGDMFISKLDGSGNFVWAKSMVGNEYYHYSGGTSITFDPIGNGSVYTTGYFSGTVDFDPGTGTFNLTSTGWGDMFISKLDSSGNFVWAKSMVGNADYYHYSYGTSITFDPDGSGGVYTTGSFEGTVDFDPGAGVFNLTAPEYYYSSWCWNEECYCYTECILLESTTAMFISKLDSSGDFIWAKALVANDETGGVNGLSIAIDFTGSGDVYTTGNFGGTIDFDPGVGVFNLTGFGMFISKLDSSGNFVWAKAMNGDGLCQGLSISVASGSGDVYTTGLYWGTIDFDPGEGTFNLTRVEIGSDIFVSKLDNSGNFIWAKAMSGISWGSGRGCSLAIDPSTADIYSTGYFGGTIDFDPGAGLFSLTSSGGFDIFISKIDNSGNFVWAKAIGGTGQERGLSITIDASGHVNVAGTFESQSISFDSTTLTNADTNTSDIFIAKLGPCPGIVTNNNNIGDGSLRDIISCSSSGANITFDVALTDQTILLTSGEIVINKNLNLSGLGILELTISGNNASRIFRVLPGKNLDIENLSLINATSLTNGGAIFSEGNLILENVLLQNNFENGIPKALTIDTGALVTIIANVEIKY